MNERVFPPKKHHKFTADVNSFSHLKPHWAPAAPPLFNMRVSIVACVLILTTSLVSGIIVPEVPFDGLCESQWIPSRDLLLQIPFYVDANVFSLFRDHKGPRGWNRHHHLSIQTWHPTYHLRQWNIHKAPYISQCPCSQIGMARRGLLGLSTRQYRRRPIGGCFGRLGWNWRTGCLRVIYFRMVPKARNDGLLLHRRSEQMWQYWYHGCEVRTRADGWSLSPISGKLVQMAGFVWDCWEG